MYSINQNKGSIQQQITKLSNKSDSQSFFNLLTNDDLFDKLEEQLPEHREREFPPTETLSMFLSQMVNPDSSCQKAVNDAAFKRLISGFKNISLATGGYCKARQRIPLEMISTLTKYSAELINEQIPNKWKFNNREVKIIDGTTVSMPDTKANQKEFPQSLSQKTGLGFPVSRIVGITSLSSGVLLDAAIGPCKGKGTSEQDLLRQISPSFNEGDIILGDAYFGTYFFLAELLSKNVDGVFEQMGSRKKSCDFTKGERLGVKDHIVTLNKPQKKPTWMSVGEYKAAPVKLRIRELKVSGKLLITTFLSKKEMTKKKLKEFYKSRWHIELDIRNIKTTMGMAEFKCKTPTMVIKEMWVYLLAYNLIRMLMVQAAISADIAPRKISFKHTMQMWIIFNQHQVNVNNPEMVGKLIFLVASKIVGNRSGRIEPRAVKRRHNNMPRLMKQRHVAREEIRKNGHPKKLK